MPRPTTLFIFVCLIPAFIFSSWTRCKDDALRSMIRKTAMIIKRAYFISLRRKDGVHLRDGLHLKRMIIKRIYLMVLGLIIFLTACSKDETQTPAHQIDLNSLIFEHSMKGWELYSWQNGNDWNYSILMGTNRLKSYEEVINNEIVVTGKDSLKLVLDRFPAGETITWLGPGWLARCWGNDYKNLSLPPQAIIDEIKQYCIDHHLILVMTD